jgi:hypothetical protein
MGSKLLLDLIVGILHSFLSVASDTARRIACPICFTDGNSFFHAATASLEKGFYVPFAKSDSLAHLEAGKHRTSAASGMVEDPSDADMESFCDLACGQKIAALHPWQPTVLDILQHLSALRKNRGEFCRSNTSYCLVLGGGFAGGILSCGLAALARYPVHDIPAKVTYYPPSADSCDLRPPAAPIPFRQRVIADSEPSCNVCATQRLICVISRVNFRS